jgi:hypothetical protein
VRYIVQITNKKILTFFYLLGIVGLFLYSFTQIDLSLTLSRASWVQQFEKSFQYIGYFNRPLSTYLFVGTLLVLYFFYTQLLISLKTFSYKKVWILVIVSGVLLSVAYNAFSYDLFNYIFDAKIITHYHQNPYEHKALDYPAEPMLSFMHWTHRVYPYGPVWLGLTIPLSYLGRNYFLVTFFLFKFLMLGAFFATVWLIGKILEITDPTYKKLGIAFFGLNPFVLIESLVSAHVDIVMMFFIMCGMYFLIKKNYMLTFLLLVLGYGIKFASAAYTLPIHVGVIISFALGLFIFSKIQKKLSWETVFILCGCLMILPVILASVRTNFQPWYLLSILPFAALVCKKYYIFLPTVLMSFFVLLEYMPYLFLGNWDPPVPDYLVWIRITGISIALLTAIAWFFLVKKGKNDTIISL